MFVYAFHKPTGFVCYCVKHAILTKIKLIEPFSTMGLNI